MADETSNTEEPKKGGLALKTLMILAGVLVLEVVTVLVVFSMAGKPAPVKADGAADDAEAMANKLVEELVVADKFPNSRTNRTYLYDTEVYITIRTMNQAMVREKIDQMSARISTDIALIISRAEPTHLLEPTRATLTRQIAVSLDERLGKDEEGNSFVQDVLIRKLTQFRADL